MCVQCIAIGILKKMRHRVKIALHRHMNTRYSCWVIAQVARLHVWDISAHHDMELKRHRSWALHGKRPSFFHALQASFHALQTIIDFYSERTPNGATTLITPCRFSAHMHASMMSFASTNLGTPTQSEWNSSGSLALQRASSLICTLMCGDPSNCQKRTTRPTIQIRSHTMSPHFTGPHNKTASMLCNNICLPICNRFALGMCWGRKMVSSPVIRSHMRLIQSARTVCSRTVRCRFGDSTFAFSNEAWE